MASIYKEGSGWSARVRMNGKSVYKGGFDSQKSAKKWARDQETELDEQKASRGMGRDTPLALRDYVYECVATQKGCKAVVSVHVVRREVPAGDRRYRLVSRKARRRAQHRSWP